MSQPGFIIDLTRIALSASEETPTRIPLAQLGTFYKGKQRFTITRNDIARMAENFAKRGNGQVVLDYEHASEHPELAAGGPIPAAGWIVAIDPEPDAQKLVWGEVNFTPLARKLIEAKEYKFISPVINWAARDKSTGEAQGATLQSAAMTNTPFLDGMPAISLSEAGWQMAEFSEQGESNVAKEPVMCSEHPKTPMLCPTCDADQISKLAASEHRHEGPRVVSLSEVARDASGRLNLAAIDKGSVVSMDVFTAYQREQVALSEVQAAIDKGKIAPSNREKWTKVALSDIDTFRDLIKDLQQVDLSERGIGGEGATGNASEYDKVSLALSEKATEISKKDGVPYATAFKRAMAANPDLVKRRNELADRATRTKEEA